MCSRFMRLVAGLLVGGLLGNLAVHSSIQAAQASVACAPDMTSISRLQALAKQKGALGATAKSALLYLAREGRPTSGYYMAKSSSSAGKGKLAFQLYHESGFSKPCVVGNQSGMDGVLVVDAATHEVEALLLDQ